MHTSVLNIKNMVCARCIKVVKDELEKLGLKVKNINLGEAEVTYEKDNFNLEKIRSILEENGFELLDDRQAKLIEDVKITVINLIHHKSEDESLKMNFSKYLSDKLGVSYQHISSLFSSIEGITLEKYIINQKIEKVKELLVYNELTLSEIAYKLDYSSVHHLSNQFKKTTGFTPSEFKKLKKKTRLPLDKV